MGNPLTDPSFRRYTALLAGTIAALGNKKLGLDLDPAQLSDFLIFVGGYIVASNGKEAIVARSIKAGNDAVAATLPGPTTDAKVDAMSKGELP